MCVFTIFNRLHFCEINSYITSCGVSTIVHGRAWVACRGLVSQLRHEVRSFRMAELLSRRRDVGSRDLWLLSSGPILIDHSQPQSGTELGDLDSEWLRLASSSSCWNIHSNSTLLAYGQSVTPRASFYVVQLGPKVDPRAAEFGRRRRILSLSRISAEKNSAKPNYRRRLSRRKIIRLRSFISPRI